MKTPDIPCLGSVTDMHGNTLYILPNGTEMLHARTGAVILRRDGHTYKTYAWSSPMGLDEIARAHGGVS